MADPNPVRLWRRLLSLPNDSTVKTLGMAFAVSAVCALVVSVAAVMLRPLQEANRAAQQQARLEEVVTTLPGVDAGGVPPGAGKMETLVVDLATGLKAPGVDPAKFDMRTAAAAEETSTLIAADADFARIGRRPNLARIHVLRSPQRLELVVLPIYGSGYQSTIHAFLTLRGDLNTVASLKIIEHGETPGLGAKIEDPAWQQLWPGKQISDASGEVRLSVVRGTGTTVHEVDGITGATRTVRGVSNMLKFWLGENGYGPVLENLRSGKL